MKDYVLELHSDDNEKLQYIKKKLKGSGINFKKIKICKHYSGVYFKEKLSEGVL